MEQSIVGQVAARYLLAGLPGALMELNGNDDTILDEFFDVLGAEGLDRSRNGSSKSRLDFMEQEGFTVHRRGFLEGSGNAKGPSELVDLLGPFE
jgi:hypothetical protein